MNLKTLLIAAGALVSLPFSQIGAESNSLTVEKSPATSNLVSDAKSKSDNNACLRNTWKPYFTRISNYQPKRATFYQGNVGIGFLYFSDIQGNLGLNPEAYRDNYKTSRSNAALQGRLSYNRTPVYENVFGYQFNNWLKAGLSFQSQTNVTVSTDWQLVHGSVLRGSQVPFAAERLTTDLNLYGLTAKVYFNFPFSLVIKRMATNGYLSAGVGPCWQTWRNVQVQRTENQSTFTDVITLNQVITPSAMFSMDMGFSTTWLAKTNSFRVVKGVRFNLWGQSGTFGKAKDQQFVTFNKFLTNGLRIKTVYQFAPYLGLQWDF